MAIVSAGAEGAHKTNLKILTEHTELTEQPSKLLERGYLFTVFPNPSLPRLEGMFQSDTDTERVDG